MTPTMKLRFVMRPVEIFGMLHVEKILQQWWEVVDSDIPDCGEWRDVPVEEESK